MMLKKAIKCLLYDVALIGISCFAKWFEYMRELKVLQTYDLTNRHVGYLMRVLVAAVFFIFILYFMHRDLPKTKSEKNLELILIGGFSLIVQLFIVFVYYMPTFISFFVIEGIGTQYIYLFTGSFIVSLYRYQKPY